MSISRFTYSRILATVRGTDYAHPGEAEGIDCVLRHLNAISTQTVLDVGCGLGGTAGYVTEAGYGKVLGIDPDAQSIAHATKHHPSAEYRIMSAEEVRALGRTFDVVLLMNVAYLCEDKESLFAALATVAHPGTHLVISDFFDHDSSGERISIDGSPTIPWPLVPSEFPAHLQATGWRLNTIQDLSANYARWYTAFVERIVSRRSDILDCADEDAYKYVLTKYSLVRDVIIDRRLGGGIASLILAPAQAG